MGNRPPNPCKKDPEGHNRKLEAQLLINKQYGRNSWRYQYIRNTKPCPTRPAIKIPQFDYPKNILLYIESQSTSYQISYTDPGSSAPVTLQIPPESPSIPQDIQDISLNSTLVAWEYTSFSPMGGPLDSATTPPPPTSPPTPTPTSTPYIQPAYSEPTPRFTKRSKRVTIPPNEPITPGTPPIWEAAINAMRFTTGLNLPITTNQQMYTVYINLKNNILELLSGAEENNEKNAAALIYFCTVVTEVFKPFNEFISYNYLNGKYPSIFSDSKAYRKFCMINHYSIEASILFDKNEILKTYIPLNNRIMKYMVPPLLNSVISVLEE